QGTSPRRPAALQARWASQAGRWSLLLPSTGPAGEQVGAVASDAFHVGCRAVIGGPVWDHDDPPELVSLAAVEAPSLTLGSTRVLHACCPAHDDVVAESLPVVAGFCGHRATSNIRSNSARSASSRAYFAMHSRAARTSSRVTRVAAIVGMVSTADVKQ